MLKPSNPIDTPSLTKEEVEAVQKTAQGQATEYQQSLAIRTIVEKICRTYDLPYIPSDPHGTSFLAGRIHSGQRIVRLTKTPTGNLTNE